MSEILITTWAAFFMYFSQGLFFILPGALTPTLSEYFGVSLSMIGYCFSFMVVARTVGNLYAGRNFLRLRLHRFMLLTTLLSIGLLIMPFFVKSLLIFNVATITVSVLLGMHFAVSNNIILYLYVGRKRSQITNYLNFFYSAGAILSPLVFSFILREGLYWAWIFVVVAVLLLPSLLVLKADEGQFFADDEDGTEAAQLQLNKHMKLGALSIGLNVMAEIIFSAWLPVFLIERLALTLPAAAFALVMLWLGFAAGRLLCGSLAKYISEYNLIFILSGIVMTSVLLLFYGLDYLDYRAVILLLGLGLSGMYSNILLYGNNQSPRPDVKLMTLLTTTGNVGSMLGLFVSSFMKSFAAGAAIMLFAAALSLASTSCIAVSRLSKRPG